MGVIPLTSILSRKGRGGHFHLSVALHRSMKTRNDMGRFEIDSKWATDSLIEGNYTAGHIAPFHILKALVDLLQLQMLGHQLVQL